MLSFVAGKHTFNGPVLTAAKQGILRTARANYQTYSPHGAKFGRSSKSGRLFSRFLGYLRHGAAALSRVAPRGDSLASTAAGRLRAAMPHGPRFLAKTMMKKAGVRYSMRTVSKSVFRYFGSTRKIAQFTSTRMSSSRWAFSIGGKWSPYSKLFSQSFNLATRSLSTAQMMAQLQRQTLAGITTKNKGDISIVTPLINETRIKMLSTANSDRTLIFESQSNTETPNKKSTATTTTTAAYHFGGRNAKTGGKAKHTAAETTIANGISNGDTSAFLDHPAAAAIKNAVPVEECVLITVPYTTPAMDKLALGNNISSIDVAKLLSDAQSLQKRHTLLLTRLLERLSATGWSIYYHSTSKPVDGVQIALPPSTGIRSAADIESLLADWGFDLSLFAATVRDPLVVNERYNKATPTKSSRISSKPSIIASQDIEDLDSRLFSLIVDDLVDPEEAYREEIRDFLSELEMMPHIRSPTKKRGLSFLGIERPYFAQEDKDLNNV